MGLRPSRLRRLWKNRRQDPSHRSRTTYSFREASELQTVDAVYSSRLTPDHIAEIIDLIPEDWLLGWPGGQTPEEIRSVYTQFLITRIAASAIFVKEALHARHALV